MKTRIGFVSNSSSSSFVIIGRKISMSDIKKEKEFVYLMGDYFGEGQDIVELNDEMKDYIFANEDIFDCYHFVTGIIDPSTINKKTLPNGDLEIFCGEKNQHSSTNLSDMMRHYSKEYK